jgi:hypothetical protein
MGGPKGTISPEEGVVTTFKLIKEINDQKFNATFWEDNHQTDF